MPLFLTPRIEALSRAITGRERSLFAKDRLANEARIIDRIRDARVLVVGGAGSIGSATIEQLVPLGPKSLCVMDTNENNIAELIRHLRSDARALDCDLSIAPLDYGSPLAAGFLESQKPFDLVLSFAAQKHVRSERDVYSLLRMCEVNLLAADRFLSALRRFGHGARGVFFVSTDKAARPTSLMGATKRLMEGLLWSHTEEGAPASLVVGGTAPPLRRACTARFANVAFSDGSLPWSYLLRLEKGQPLAGPADARRYLVSPRESGELCLLAATCAETRRVIVPIMDPSRDAVSMLHIAETVLAEQQLTPAWYDDEQVARIAVKSDLERRCYPVLRTRSDTSGEKLMEEFVALDEKVVDIGMDSLEAIPARRVDRARLASLLCWLTDASRGAIALPSRSAMVAAMGELVTDLAPGRSTASLDSKM